MGCINVREGDGRIIFYKLNGCGDPIEGPNSKLVLKTVATIGYEDTVTEGDEVDEKNFAGESVFTSAGQDTMSNIAVNLTHDGINPSLENFLMGAATKTRSGEVVGFGRTDLNSEIAVAVEILVEIGAEACTEGATAAPIAGWFFPFIKNWRPNAGTELNGTDLVKPQYVGKGFKNSRIFSGSVSDADFAKWSTIHDAGDEWYTFYAFDGTSYDLPDPSCEPVTLG